MNDSDLNKLISAGRVAKAKAYQDLLRKVSDGHRLTQSEVRTLLLLERDLDSKDSGEGDSGRLAGMNAAAEYLGASRRMISYHIKRGNLRQNLDGTFDRTELDRFIAKYGRKKKGGKAEDLSAKDAADLRYRLARAAREERMCKQLDGTLVSREWIERQLTARAHELSRSLIMMSRRIGHRIAAASEEKLKDVMNILDDEVRQMMAEYTRKIEEGK